MSTDSIEQFPVNTEHLGVSDLLAITIGNRLLEGVDIEVTVLDQPENEDRIRALPFDDAKKVNPDFHYYPASLVKKRLEGEQVRIGYARGLVESAAALVASNSLMSKTFLRRAMRKSYEEASRTRERLSETGMVVSPGFTIMRRAAILPASNNNGEIFDVKLEQIALEGEITLGNESYSYARSNLATALSFHSGRYERNDAEFAVTTAPPARQSWGVTYAVPGESLLLPGQSERFAGRGVPALLAVIADQQPRAAA